MTVSVIIPAYNASAAISRAINSALAQTRPVDEIIVVDDASTDDTPQIVGQISEENEQIRLIKLDVNSGPSRARNVGIAAAKSDWIAILDADDAWRPKRLERLVEIAELHHADLVADNQILYDAVTEKEARLGFAADWDYCPISLESIFRDEILDRRTPAYPPLKPIFRRAFLISAGIHYDESARYGEDFKFHVELLFKGAKAILTREAYYIYSTRIGEISKKNSPNSKSVPRFDLLVKMSDELENRYRHLITPSIASAIAERRANFRLIHLSNVAREIRRSGHYFKFSLYLLKHPDLALLLSKRIWRGMIRTLPAPGSPSRDTL